MEFRDLLNAESLAESIARSIGLRGVLEEFSSKAEIEWIPVHVSGGTSSVFTILRPEAEHTGVVVSSTPSEITDKYELDFSREIDQWVRISHHFSYWGIACTCRVSLTGQYFKNTDHPPIEEVINRVCAEKGIEKLYVSTSHHFYVGGSQIEDLQAAYEVEIREIEEENPFWFVKPSQSRPA
jgi:hypothetical protein